jgi:hypothetical protein
MFLYAKLVLTNLLALPTREEVIDAMQEYNFPRGLKEAYVENVSRTALCIRPGSLVYLLY